MPRFDIRTGAGFGLGAEWQVGRNVRSVLPPHSGTVTFLFTDIEGSTRLWEQFPDDDIGAEMPEK